MGQCKILRNGRSTTTHDLESCELFFLPKRVLLRIESSTLLCSQKCVLRIEYLKKMKTDHNPIC